MSQSIFEIGTSNIYSFILRLALHQINRKNSLDIENHYHYQLIRN